MDLQATSRSEHPEWDTGGCVSLSLPTGSPIEGLSRHGLGRGKVNSFRTRQRLVIPEDAAESKGARVGYLVIVYMRDLEENEMGTRLYVGNLPYTTTEADLEPVVPELQPFEFEFIVVGHAVAPAKIRSRYGDAGSSSSM